MEKRSSTSVRVFYPRFDTQQLVDILQQGVAQLQQYLPLKLVVLFGSYARGNYTVASDIDLLVVYQGEKRENVYKVIRNALPLPCLELHLYSASDYVKMKALLDRMIGEGKIIYGQP